MALLIGFPGLSSAEEESEKTSDTLANEKPTRRDSATLTALRVTATEQLDQLNDEERYDESADVALKIVRLTQEEFGNDARQVIRPLMALARAQRNGRKLATAEINVSSAIAIIEKHDGSLSAELVEPLTMLAELHNESGRYEKAIQTFDRALRLNHVNLGFTNFDQFPIMDGLTGSYLSLNKFEEATFYQKSQLEIQQRRLGIDDPETTRAYFKLGRWYSRMNMFDDAILAFQKADRIVRKGLGKSSPARVEGLQGLALVYQKIGNRGLASSVLRKALQLIEESPENDPFSRAQILVALGDSLTREGKLSSAEGRYANAWKALPDDASGLADREFYFGNPVRLEGNLFPRYQRGARGRPARSLKSGSIVIDYSVDARGRVTDASVAESDPPGLMDRSFLSIYRKSLFRPRYVDGAAQASENLLAKHEFFYLRGKETSGDQSSGRADDQSDGDSDTDDTRSRERGKLSYPAGDQP